MRCAIYCRLSKEDVTTNKLDVNESESIQNQKQMLKKFASSKGWETVEIYVDDDYSGADKHRPAFNRLLRDAEKGKFNIVLCKTQSRFTRDMEIAEKYINNKFLLWGIRFVSVVDNVDTAVIGNKKARQINSLVNEWYLEDLSENIKTVLDYKRRVGQYIASFPLYGYVKNEDDRNKIEIDTEAANVVKFIFRLASYGIKPNDIVNKLNGLKLPCPARYKQIKSRTYVPPSESDKFLWNRVSVSRILKNEMYTGTMVQGKRKKLSYKHESLFSVPKDSWIRVMDNHEPIISLELFHKLNPQFTEREDSRRNLPIKGIVYCKICSLPLSQSTYSRSGKEYIYLRCSKHKINISYARLEEIIFKELIKNIKNLEIEVNPESLDIKKCIELFTSSASIGENTIEIEFFT